MRQVWLVKEQRLLLGVEAIALQGGDPGTPLHSPVFSCMVRVARSHVAVACVSGEHSMFGAVLLGVHGVLKRCATGRIADVTSYESRFLMDLAGNGFHLGSFAVFFLSCMVAF